VWFKKEGSATKGVVFGQVMHSGVCALQQIVAVEAT